jgi:hypothetical protein
MPSPGDLLAGSCGCRNEKQTIFFNEYSLKNILLLSTLVDGVAAPLAVSRSYILYKVIVEPPLDYFPRGLTDVFWQCYSLKTKTFL